LEALPAGFFKVRLKEVDTLVRCKKSGRMNQAHISLLPGDWVKVEVNQYDMNQ
jgi:translation initiation factor IF-1